MSFSTRPHKKKRKTHQLTSVQSLIREVEEIGHAGLTETFKEHTFVGCVDSRFALLQHKTKLYLCDVCLLSRELIYQQALLNFAEFEEIKLSSPAALHTLIHLALDNPASGWAQEDGDKKEIATYIVDLLKDKAPMLKEYFSFEVDADGNLLSLPQIIEGYVPDIGALATFILRMGTEVEWEHEQECLEALCREFSKFYCLQLTVEGDDTPDTNNQSKPREWIVEHIFFPIMRTNFVPPTTFADDGTIIAIASLEKLYKIFERC